MNSTSNPVKRDSEFVLRVLAIFFLGFGLILLFANFRYIVTGETVNLEEYLENESDDDLPLNKVCTANIEESYDRFYHTETHTKRSTYTTVYYLVKLTDGSVMLVASSGSNPSPGERVGKLKKILKYEVKKQYDDYLKYLQKEGVLSHHVKVRYVMLTDCSRDGNIFGICFLGGVGLICMILAVLVRFKIIK